MNNRNAYIGKNVETLFKNSIGNHLDIINKIKDVFKIKGRFLDAINTGMHAEKVDVKIGFSCGHYIDVSIKAYKAKIAYNQLTRTSLYNFCKTFDLDCLEYLQNLFINKAKKVSSSLFPIEEQQKALSIFQPISKKMLKRSFSNKTARELLALYEREKSEMRIYVMKDVLKNLDQDITFTNKGNILIGKFIVIQRKGGNGIHVHGTVDKDNLKHPGNNIQLKLKVKDFVDGMQNYVN